MDIKYTVTATLNGEDISQEINESLFSDLVAKHGPFKGLAQKIANHINENKDAMLIAQLEAKRDKKLSKAQKELVSEVVALMQSGGDDEQEEQAAEAPQEDTHDVDDADSTNAKEETETPEDSTDEDSEGTEEQPESSDDEDADTDEVLNDALADEYGEDDDDMDALLDSLGV